MFPPKHRIFNLALIVISVIDISTETPLHSTKETAPLDIHGLQFLGATSSKELYITKSRKSSFQFALGFGCPVVYGSASENNFTLAAVETLDEVEIIDTYFAATQSLDQPVEPVWTSGIDRLGNLRRQWASTGKDIEYYPTGFQGDWSPGQGYSPSVADYNCVAIWRYCNRQGHGPSIPSCNPAPFGTWFTPRPCHEERRFICERKISDGKKY